MHNNRNITVRCRAVILHEGKLLVVKHTPESAFFALPGGHLEWGEDIKGCMHREVIEELGIEPKIGRLLYVYDFENTKEVHSVEFFFEVINGADYVDCEKLPRSHAHEIARIVWMDGKNSPRILPDSICEDFKSEKLISDETRFIKNLI
jgi:ADP-ribose pyrophosphatase YjhB (NUDIX family)